MSSTRNITFSINSGGDLMRGDEWQGVLPETDAERKAFEQWKELSDRHHSAEVRFYARVEDGKPIVDMQMEFGTNDATELARIKAILSEHGFTTWELMEASYTWPPAGKETPHQPTEQVPDHWEVWQDVTELTSLQVGRRKWAALADLEVAELLHAVWCVL